MADYISKNEALNLIMHNDKVCHYADERYENVVYATACRISDVVANMPAADVQPVKRGNWVQIGEQSAKCTECGGVLKSNGIDKTGKALIFNAVYHYCPNCGARMTKDGDTDA